MARWCSYLVGCGTYAGGSVMCQLGWAKLHFPEFTLCTFVARVETFLGKIWRVEVEQQPMCSSLTHCYLPAGSPTHVDSTASAPLYHEPSFSFSNSWVRGTFISKWRTPDSHTGRPCHPDQSQ